MAGRLAGRLAGGLLAVGLVIIVGGILLLVWSVTSPSCVEELKMMDCIDS